MHGSANILVGATQLLSDGASVPASTSRLWQRLLSKSAMEQGETHFSLIHLLNVVGAAGFSTANQMFVPPWDYGNSTGDVLMYGAFSMAEEYKASDLSLLWLLVTCSTALFILSEVAWVAFHHGWVGFVNAVLMGFHWTAHPAADSENKETPAYCHASEAMLLCFAVVLELGGVSFITSSKVFASSLSLLQVMAESALPTHQVTICSQ